jgi:hypothetical protein
LCDNYGSIILKCSNLQFGQITLTAQPFSRTNAKGRGANTLSLTFSIVAAAVNKNPTTAPIVVSSAPTQFPTSQPAVLPVGSPTNAPIVVSKAPTQTPTSQPVALPVCSPTNAPIHTPTKSPSRPTSSPIMFPVPSPTNAPIRPPTKSPSRPTSFPVTSSYDITLSLIGSELSQSDVITFQTAANRWKQLVVGDVLDIRSSGYELPMSGCTAPTVIDDLLICGKVAPIDGPSNVLGYAGLYWLRGNNIPFIGQMVFDSAYVMKMREQNKFYSVILHEMGHVMGIGTIWERAGITGKSSENCPY